MYFTSYADVKLEFCQDGSPSTQVITNEFYTSIRSVFLCVEHVIVENNISRVVKYTHQFILATWAHSWSAGRHVFMHSTFIHGRYRRRLYQNSFLLWCSIFLKFSCLFIFNSCVNSRNEFF